MGRFTQTCRTAQSLLLQEKWAIFWCDLLSPLIYDDIKPEATNRFLEEMYGLTVPRSIDEKISLKVILCGQDNLRCTKCNYYKCKLQLCNLQL